MQNQSLFENKNKLFFLNSNLLRTKTFGKRLDKIRKIEQYFLYITQFKTEAHKGLKWLKMEIKTALFAD